MNLIKISEHKYRKQIFCFGIIFMSDSQFHSECVGKKKKKLLLNSHRNTECNLTTGKCSVHRPVPFRFLSLRRLSFLRLPIIFVSLLPQLRALHRAFNVVVFLPVPFLAQILLLLLLSNLLQFLRSLRFHSQFSELSLFYSLPQIVCSCIIVGLLGVEEGVFIVAEWTLNYYNILQYILVY